MEVQMRSLLRKAIGLLLVASIGSVILQARVCTGGNGYKVWTRQADGSYTLSCWMAYPDGTQADIGCGLWGELCGY